IVDINADRVSVRLNTTPSRAAKPTFGAPHSFGTGNRPISTTAADINGDGRPDLIVTNGINNTVSVLLNTTPQGGHTPSFAPHETFDTREAPLAVTAADINGDGKPDLIIVNAMDDSVSVLINTTPAHASKPSFALQQVL